MGERHRSLYDALARGSLRSCLAAFIIPQVDKNLLSYVLNHDQGGHRRKIVTLVRTNIGTG